MKFLYTGNIITDDDAEDMISVSDLDGDGRINFKGTRPYLSCRPHPLRFTTPATFVIQSLSRYMQFALFLRFAWSLIVIDADDATNVIMPCHLPGSRIGVNSSRPSITCVPELKVKECKGKSVISCVFGSRSTLCLSMCRPVSLCPCHCDRSLVLQYAVLSDRDIA